MEKMSRNRSGTNGNGSRPTIDYLLTGINKRPVVGFKNSITKLQHSRKLLKRIRSQLSYADQKLFTSRQFAEGSNKYEDFFSYADSDESDGEADSGDDAAASSNSSMFQNVSLNIADYISQRPLGNLRVKQPVALQPCVKEKSFNAQSDFAIKHLLTNGILQEKAIKVENINKVFCSQWLSDKQVILGTKCNKVSNF